MAKRENMLPRPKFCAGSKTVADKSRKHLFPQHMFPARLNWESFASAPTFSCLPDLSVFAQTHKLENFASQLGCAGNMLLKRNLCFESKNIFGSLSKTYLFSLLPFVTAESHTCTFVISFFCDKRVSSFQH